MEPTAHKRSLATGSSEKLNQSQQDAKTSEQLTLEASQLAVEKSRRELQKLDLEIHDLAHSWTRFLVGSAVSVLAPLFTVLVFLVGWYGSHATDRRHQRDDLYASAEKKLKSPDPEIRLSAVLTLNAFIPPTRPSLVARVFSETSAESPEQLEKNRTRNTIALLLSALSRETDPMVLDAIAQGMEQEMASAETPLLAENKNAGKRFARACGQFSGLSILKDRNASRYDQDTPGTAQQTLASVQDIENSVLRAPGDDTFSARQLVLAPGSVFRLEFGKQQRIAMGSDQDLPTRTTVPDNKELVTALADVNSAAVTLGTSSYVIARITADQPDWFKATNLSEVALVGHLKLSDEAFEKLRIAGAYVSTSFGGGDPRVHGLD